MSKKRIRIASVSYLPRKWDKDANLKKILKGLRQAKNKRADIAVFCEGMLEGYVVNELKKRDERKFFDLGERIPAGPYVQAISAEVRQLGIFAVVGMLERSGRFLYNSAALFDTKGRIIGVYRKTHFYQGYSGADPAFYRPGNEIPVFRTPLAKIAIMICFDRQVPEVARSLMLSGAEIIIVPSYGEHGESNTCLMRTRARENGLPVIFTHPKQSLMIDSGGKVVSECRRNEIAVASLTLEKKPRTFFKSRRRPAVFKKIIGAE
jgi:predicted amidohydrolase